MIYEYETPSVFDNLILKSDGKYLIEISFIDKKSLDNEIMCYSKVFDSTIKWLDLYFSNSKIDFLPEFRLVNLSSFRKLVIRELLNVEFGNLCTYKDIAENIKIFRNKEKMSSQAVGNALKNNPIAIVIPCHRVIGTNKGLVGYNGGLNNKISLLELEGHKIIDGKVYE